MNIRFRVISCFVIIALAFSIQRTDAAPITREFEQDFIYLGSKIFSFKIIVNIETEANGKWRLDTYYFTNLTMTLTYLNESQFDANAFRLLYHSARLLVNDLAYGHGAFNVVSDLASVTTVSNGTISIKYRPNILDGEELQLKPLVEYTIYDHEQAWSLEPSWTCPNAIVMDVEKEATGPDYSSFILYAVGGIVIAAVVAFYLVFRSRKSRRTQPNHETDAA